MRKLKNRTILGVITLSGLFLVSCFDKGYDLSDIDATLGTNTQVTIPTSSTGTITLKNIVNLKEEGAVKMIKDPVTGDSIYCLRQSGETSKNPIRIGAIRIPQPKWDEVNTMLRLRQSVEASAMSASLVYDSSIPDTECYYDIDPAEAQYSIQTTYSEEVNHDVVSIEHLECQDVTMTFHLNAEGFPVYMDKVWADNLTLNIPDGLELKNVKFQQEEVNYQGGNTILLTDANGKQLKVSDGMDITVTLTGIKEGTVFSFDKQTHKVKVDGLFTLSGSLRIKTEDIDKDYMNTVLTPEQKAKIQEDQSYISLFPPQLQFESESQMSGDIIVDHLTGQITHSIEANEIDITDIPDFLLDEDIVLDLENPVVTLKADHGMSGSLTTQATFTSLKNGEELAQRSTSIITLSPKTNNQLYFADHETTILPEEFTGSLYVPVKDLGGLIRQIPDQIKIEMAPLNIKVQDLDLNEEFPVNTSYELYAPFTFGKDFSLIYRDTEDGWIEDLDNVKDLDMGGILVEAKVTSNIPAKLNFRLIPIDEYGQRIDATEDMVVEAPANADGAPISMQLKPKAGYTLHDLVNGLNGLNKLDGVIYEAVVKEPLTGEALGDEYSVKLTNMKISVIGGIILDAN